MFKKKLYFSTSALNTLSTEIRSMDDPRFFNSSASSTPTTPRKNSNLNSNFALFSKNKPRTLKQQKNKKKQKALEKEFLKNERWKCPPSREVEQFRQIILIPSNFQERAVDCDGLDEILSSKFNGIQSASSTQSIPNQFDTENFTKTKSKTSRFRRLSQIFNFTKNKKNILGSKYSISVIDLPISSNHHLITGYVPDRSIQKSKSQFDLRQRMNSNFDRIVLLGRESDRKNTKFDSSNEEEFRKKFIRGWWSSNSKRETQQEPCQSVDSGYGSPEISTKIESIDADQSPKSMIDKNIQTYDRFDTSKASLFNLYFAKNDDGDGDGRIEKAGNLKFESDAREIQISQSSNQKINDQIEVDGSSNMEEVKDSNSVEAEISPRQTINQNHFPIVVAIDFGTSFCGYAYAFRHKPDQIFFMRRSNHTDSIASSPKLPTCLLLKPDGRFHSFGWEAREFYHDLDPSMARRFLYFENFKSILDSEENLTRHTQITALNGQPWPVVDVFCHCLRYLKREALTQLMELVGSSVDPGHLVQWVITVPASWRQSAKQIMRLSCYQAGLGSPEHSDRLLIALDAEAAAAYCRLLKDDEISPNLLPPRTFFSLPSSLRRNPMNLRKIYERDFQSVQLALGDVYVVVDCGGGKVDVVVHRVTINGEIEEVNRASGGLHGSSEIDRAFETLLCDIFSADFFNEFRQRYPAAFLDLMRSFELRKRSAHPYKSNSFNVALPFPFLELYRKLHGHKVECAVRRYSKKGSVEWNPQGMLRLSPELMSLLFMPTMVSIVQLIEEATKHLEISYLFLLGGFAESPLLQHEIRSAFETRCKIIVPHQTTTSTLQGSILFSLNRKLVTSRKSRFTFGISVLQPFDPIRHPLDKKITKNGRDWCKEIFEKFLTVNESITNDQQIIRHFCPASSDQKQIVIPIYSSESPNPKLLSDFGVKKCAVIKFDLPIIANGNREIKAAIKFGETEITLSAESVENGELVNGYIDFLC